MKNPFPTFYNLGQEIIDQHWPFHQVLGVFIGGMNNYVFFLVTSSPT
jgi:hypothetical protein